MEMNKIKEKIEKKHFKISGNRKAIWVDDVIEILEELS